ncbi:MAG: hypothetical protein HY961_19475, partial [Ignavibacteriae bacterium]|nr:hypothetical protein [Ignavibacteriota bacterium]
MNRVDSVYELYYPTWLVLDNDMKERIYRAFISRYGACPRDPNVKIVSNGKKDRIVSVAVGTTVMGRLDARTNLSQDLYHDILVANYPMRVIDPIPPPQRIYEEYKTPQFLGVSASAFGATLVFSNGWGLEVKMGNEEIGYHFWSTGNIRLRAIIDDVRIGIVGPIALGGKSPDAIEPLTLRPRKLSGVKGISLGYNHAFEFGDINAEMSVGDLNRSGAGANLVDPIYNYFLRSVAQATYTNHQSLGDGKHRFKLTGGMGFHQINLGETQTDQFFGDGSMKILSFQKNKFVSPILRVEYTKVGDRMYGVGTQYYSSILFVNAWAEVLKDFLFVDLKYYAPVFRSH